MKKKNKAIKLIKSWEHLPIGAIISGHESILMCWINEGYADKVIYVTRDQEFKEEIHEIHERKQFELKLLEKYGINESAEKKNMSTYRKSVPNDPNIPSPTLTNPNNPNNPNISSSCGIYEGIVQSMLKKERPKVNQLKWGIKKGVFYFGTVIYEGFKPHTAVITSDKNVYIDLYKKPEKDQEQDPTFINHIKSKFGLNYRHDFQFEVLDNHISIEGIARFLNTNQKRTLQYCFDKLVENNKECIYYPDEISHSLVALEIIGTYFMPCFEAYGRNCLVADKGSGKTEQSRLFKIQACNTVMINDITKSSFFRMMESTCGTLIIDDFDSINPDKSVELMQHYKTGYKSVTKTTLTGDSNNKRKQEVFRNYGHVVINNTVGLGEIEMDRTIPLIIIKSFENIKIKPINEKNPKYQRLTDDLFICALQNWEEVMDTYKNLKSEKLESRRFEISKAILSIAKIIDKNLFYQIENFLYETFEQRDIAGKDLDNDWSFLGVTYFKDLLVNDITKPVRIKDIAEYIHNKTKGLMKAYEKDETHIHRISTYLGKVFHTMAAVFKLTRPNNQSTVQVKNIKVYDQFLKSNKFGGLGSLGYVRDVRVVRCKEKNTTIEEEEIKMGGEKRRMKENEADNEIVYIEKDNLSHFRQQLSTLCSISNNGLAEASKIIKHFDNKCLEKWKEQGVYSEPISGYFKLVESEA